MHKMIWISLGLNVAVLVPVCVGLLFGMAWAEEVYGPAVPARGILLAVYLAIAVGSAALLLRRQPLFVAPLLALQVVYKLATPLTVGTLTNPVVLSNLAIAAVHIVTLALIVRAQRAGSARPAGAGRAHPQRHPYVVRAPGVSV